MNENVKEFKQSIGDSIFGVFLIIAGAGFLGYYVVTSKLDLVPGLVLLGLIGVGTVYSIINVFKDMGNYFELEGTTLRYFQKKEFKYEWDLKTVNVNYNVTQRRRSTDAILTINDGVKEVKIGVSHLNHDKLYKAICSLEEPKVLEL